MTPSIGILLRKECTIIHITNTAYEIIVNSMSNTGKKNPLKRDQALNDATHGQFGEEPRPEPKPDTDERMEDKNHRKDRVRSARKMSKNI